MVRTRLTTGGFADPVVADTAKSLSKMGHRVILLAWDRNAKGEETVTTETSDGLTDTRLDHTGFVSAKVKGDGYYSQPDGVHTVAYQVNSTMTGSIKMQGSLATTPTEDDFFDITGTTFTADQSTLIFTANFNGNFVWVRAKATSVTDGTISSILINS